MHTYIRVQCSVAVRLSVAHGLEDQKLLSNVLKSSHSFGRRSTTELRKKCIRLIKPLCILLLGRSFVYYPLLFLRLSYKSPLMTVYLRLKPYTLSDQ